MLNNYYYRSIICKWIWELFENYLVSKGHFSYRLKVGYDDKVYVECEGGSMLWEDDIQNLIKITGLKVFVPRADVKLKTKDYAAYSNYYYKTKKVVIIIDDPYFRISNRDKNDSNLNSYFDDEYDQPTKFITEHYKVLSPNKNYYSQNEQHFANKIILGFYNQYKELCNEILRSLRSNNANDIKDTLTKTKTRFVTNISIPNRFLVALKQSGYYSYVELGKVRFLLGLHNIDITNELVKEEDPITSINMSLPIDDETINTMCEVADNNLDLIKSSLTNLDISFIFKDELHKKLFANKDYYNQL